MCLTSYLSISHDNIDYSFLYKIHFGANSSFFYYDVTLKAKKKLSSW